MFTLRYNKIILKFAMPNHLFRRKIYDELLSWKRESNGETAILVEGARRIGKSTITEEFAKNEYDSYIKIDFSKVSAEIIGLFDDVSDLDHIFTQLQFTYGEKLIPRKSVIIFDEVQFAPRARQAIKHLVADGRFDYIETGSLISINQNVKGILIPSEEDNLKMYPMDFEEFLWALGEKAIPDLLREAAKKMQPIGAIAHRKMMRLLRLYMLVGGMPKAVSTYIDTLDLQSVDVIKRKIIKLYESDFRKIDASGKIGRFFDNIPGQLAKKSLRFQPTPVAGSLTPTQEENIISELSSSMTVNFCYHTSDPTNGLSMDYDKDYYKIYAADTGLFVTLAFKDKAFTDNIIYGKLLSDKLDANMGYVYENLVAQMLATTGRNLYYYTFPTEKSRHNYEIDFLIMEGNKVDPIEVKSSGYRSHASLDAFRKKYSSKVKTPYLFYSKDVYKENGIIYVPFYLIPFMDIINNHM